MYFDNKIWTEVRSPLLPSLTLLARHDLQRGLRPPRSEFFHRVILSPSRMFLISPRLDLRVHTRTSRFPNPRSSTSLWHTNVRKWWSYGEYTFALLLSRSRCTRFRRNSFPSASPHRFPLQLQIFENPDIIRNRAYLFLSSV